MAVLLPVERKTAKARIFLALVYFLLILGGLTMVWPFLVMVAASFSSGYDYYRFSPAVRAVWDRGDRFLRYVASNYARFPSEIYPDAPSYWSSWIVVSRDTKAAGVFARRELAHLDDPATAARWNAMADDYAAFNRTYDIRNSVCSFDPRDIAPFVRRTFERRLRERRAAGEALLGVTALDLLNREWPVRYSSFFGIRMLSQGRAPLHHATWDYPPGDPKMELFQAFKKAYRDDAAVPMSRTVPYASRPLWRAFLRRHGVADAARADAGFYNPGDPRWDTFLHEAYPRRLLRIRVTPALTEAYRRHVAQTCRTPDAYRRLTGRPLRSFDELELPAYENSTLWRNFIPQVPLSQLDVLSAERAWWEFLLNKYGDLETVNRTYGWALSRPEDARLPLREAMAVSFAREGAKDFLRGLFANYRTVGEYLFLRGRAFGNTVLLVVLSILASLTVNPLAAYALSRFRLRATEKLLLFLLATMAFPAAVTAIPGFLLIRDLGLLNTFAALVLPTLASGMSIFILKGFFDGLPRELYEAAEIDGAGELQIFCRITLPMCAPILAVNALTAFVTAYNSWEWALLVCQEKSKWTLAVWMYQMSQEFSGQPWAVMAGFVLVSIPTAIVFIACQKVILRGIVLPSMK